MADVLDGRLELAVTAEVVEDRPAQRGVDDGGTLCRPSRSVIQSGSQQFRRSWPSGTVGTTPAESLRWSMSVAEVIAAPARS
ncbi:MAG: hypothetical protein RMM58_00915 [Chloroflexota bacterium]|nr:hypothetical protein [Dehalococcoidia bacterium]MDW8252420.1 hypothetical protein [Chloroflexota bacterium]